MASLGYTGRRRIVLGHTLNTQTLMKTDEKKEVLSKFTLLCGASFIAVLGCRLDTPERKVMGRGERTLSSLDYLTLSPEWGWSLANGQRWRFVGAALCPPDDTYSKE